MSDTKKPTVSTYEVNRYKKLIAERGAVILEKWPDSFPGGAELINSIMNGNATNKEIRAALLAHKIHIAAFPKKTLRDFLT